MLAIERLVESMQGVASQLLVERQNFYQTNFTIASVLSVASMALCLACVFAILFLLRRLAHLQTSVTLGALSEMIEYQDGTLSIEEYLKRRHDALMIHGEAQIEAERLLGLLEHRKKENHRPQRLKRGDARLVAALGRAWRSGQDAADRVHRLPAAAAKPR